MSEKIEPALTAEEWAMRCTEGGEVYATDDVVGAGETWGSFGEVASPQARHALAALALHGQPYGFDWSDVDDEREMAEGLRYILRDALKMSPEQVKRIAALAERADHRADKLAALLPPRETP